MSFLALEMLMLCSEKEIQIISSHFQPGGAEIPRRDDLKQSFLAIKRKYSMSF